jgi:proline iminopeptidase
MTKIQVRDVSLFFEVIGRGYPLLIMHGGPGVDHTTMHPLRKLADHFTLVFYDHRCNGRSECANISSMTWENLTADADQLRKRLGYDRWAVLGHSFGGMVALEYAFRYHQNLSHLLLIDTCGDIRWAKENAPHVLAQRGYKSETVELAQRFFAGEIEPQEMTRAMRKFGRAYYYKLNLLTLIREMLAGFRMKTRPEALIFGFSQLLENWSVMDRLGEIKAPTLILAGRHDFQFPPEHQKSLALGIANAHLKIIEEAGHNILSEKPRDVINEINKFLNAT